MMKLVKYPRRVTALFVIVVSLLNQFHVALCQDTSKSPYIIEDSDQDKKNAERDCTEKEAEDFGCLYGGKCIFDLEEQRPKCRCKNGHYGDKCQFMNYCYKLLVQNEKGENLSGSQICDLWALGECIESDRFLRCKCLPNEYFIFLDRAAYPSKVWPELVQQTESRAPRKISPKRMPNDSSMERELPNYLARCIPYDKCSERRCRHMSEICVDGECKCNSASGYQLDKNDGHCKLLDYCKFKENPCPRGTVCVPTSDWLNYTCIPKITTQKQNLTCLIPILNSCEQKCELTTNTKDITSRIQDNGERDNLFECSCFAGYQKIGQNGCQFDGSRYNVKASNDQRERVDSSENVKESEDGITSQSPETRSLADQHHRECIARLACKENEICISDDQTNQWTCHCDRQGYVTDQEGNCVDWCSAAKSDSGLSKLLDEVCLSGACTTKTESQQYDQVSSRPELQCNCSTSDKLELDPETGLCKLSFESIIKPCLPGHEGHKDCVLDRGAYCTVFHEGTKELLQELKGPRPDPSNSSAPFDPSSRRNPMPDGPEDESKQPSYGCVCPPDKRMIVDQQHKRAKCIDECLLLTDKCSRMNRMCRKSMFSVNDRFADHGVNLIRPDGLPNMWAFNIEPSGCECLPGFSGKSKRIVGSEMELEEQENLNATMEPLGVTNSSETINHLRNLGGYKSALTNKGNVSNCYMGDIVTRLHNVTFKAPSNFDVTWLKPFGDSQWDEYDKITPEIKREIDINWWEDDTHFGPPHYMKISNLDELIANLILIGQCDQSLASHSHDMYIQCMRYRYWQIQKLKRHFIDWRSILERHLNETFNLIPGYFKVHINSCKTSNNRFISHQKIETTKLSSQSMTSNRGCITTMVHSSKHKHSQQQSQQYQKVQKTTNNKLDIYDDTKILEGDIVCNLTLYNLTLYTDDEPIAPNPNDDIQKIIIPSEMKKLIADPLDNELNLTYYRLAPSGHIERKSFDELNSGHVKSLEPCNNELNELNYCGTDSSCEPISKGIRFRCKCRPGFNSIMKIDLYPGDKGREICEDVDECLLNMCDNNTAHCRNLIGDYRCECQLKHINEGKKCVPVCKTIDCKNGDCHFNHDQAFCTCHDGFIGYDCGMLDPSIALRRANMIICGSIIVSILLLAITVAYSQHKKLKKVRSELKQLKSQQDPINMYDFYLRQPMKHRSNSKAHASQWSNHNR